MLIENIIKNMKKIEKKKGAEKLNFDLKEEVTIGVKKNGINEKNNRCS